MADGCQEARFRLVRRAGLGNARRCFLLQRLFGADVTQLREDRGEFAVVAPQRCHFQPDMQELPAFRRTIDALHADIGRCAGGALA
jgi:hypothetical protein